jgi:hypothetical protein
MPKISSILKSISSWINKYGNFNPLLKSRIVLYFLFLLSLVNLYSFVSMGNSINAAVFILVGFLTTFFSKNMIVVMIMALAISNILLYGKHIAVEEGFDTKSENMVAEKNEETIVENTAPEKKPATPSKPSTSGSSSSTPNPTTPSKLSKESKSNITSEQVEQAKVDMKGLLELEVKLLQGVSDMQPLLEKAKETIAQIKQNVKSTSSS